MLDEYIKSEKIYQGLVRTQYEIEKQLKSHEVIVADEEQNFKAYKKIYHLNQAALLAKELSEDEACPVCGSTHHIKLAELTEDHVTEEQLARAEASLDIAINNKRTVELELQTVKVKLESTLESLETLFVQLLEEQVILGKNKSIEENKKKVESKIVELKLSLDILRESYLKLENNLEAYNKAIKDQEQISKKLVKFDSDLLTMNEQLTKKELEYAKKEVNNKTLIKEVPEDLRIAEVLKMKISASNTLLQKITEEKEMAITHHKAISDQLIQLKSRLEEVESVLDELKQKYSTEKNVFVQALTDEGFESEETYQRFKAEVTSIKKLNDRIKNHDQAMHTAVNAYEQMSKEIKCFEIQDITAFDTKIDEIQLTEKAITDMLSRIERRIDTNKIQILQINKITETIKEDEDSYKLLGKIADTINGKNSKNITLERFILKSYLNDILEVSNQRLSLMTNNRYALKISEILTDGRSSGGLDLEVSDSYTGLPRSVKTLSGGESFKASLSMALGLAEVVQSYAGGIQLDTVFIDEGFGTLDQESLDSAINCLIELQDSGRLVGIISHVEELKERINTQLIIESNELGSSTRFVVN